MALIKIRITSIHYTDAFHSERDELLGTEGIAYGFEMTGHQWYAFDFIPEGLRTPIHLQFANFEIIR